MHKNSLILATFIALILVTVATAQALEFKTYLPVALLDPTFTNTPTVTNTPPITNTPTITLTPTNTNTPTGTRTVTRTPTNTPVPKDVVIVEILHTGHIDTEWIQIKNNSGKTITMTGWKILDESRNTYEFPRGFSLLNGSSVKVWSKFGFDNDTNLYWNFDGPRVWNIGGDCGRLKDDINDLRSRWCY